MKYPQRSTVRITTACCAVIALAGCGSDDSATADTSTASASDDDAAVAETSDESSASDGRGTVLITAPTTAEEAAATSTPSGEDDTEDETATSSAEGQQVTVTAGGETIVFSSVTWCKYDDPETTASMTPGWKITAFTPDRVDRLDITLSATGDDSAFDIGFDLEDTMMGTGAAIDVSAADIEGGDGEVVSGEITDGVGSGTATLETGLDGQGEPIEASWEVNCNPF